MRLILSRKGFDSSAGGRPSPIFPDGSMLSFPIPARSTGTTYGELAWNGRSIGSIVEELTGGRVPSHFGVHLDPDLRAETVPREAGWRPSFGQAGAAQSVLAREGVGPGDLFLFFGWFKQVEERAGRLRYVPGSPDLHVIFGWLQVGQVFALPTDRTPRWAASHPHVVQPPGKLNTLYVASKQLMLGGKSCGLSGAGSFARYRESCRLTARGRTRSVWQVPLWLYPGDGRPALGYHEDPARWQLEGDRLLLRSVHRGQEFVLDLDSYPEAVPWLRELPVGGALEPEGFDQ